MPHRHHTIYPLIDHERTYQDSMYGPVHDDTHTPSDWISYIVKHATKANAQPDEVFKRQMVRVAALAVAAIEAHDRIAELKRLGHNVSIGDMGNSDA